MPNETNRTPYEILSETPKYNWNTIQSRFADSYFINVRDMLPYKKAPMQLSREQLHALINETRAHRWKILDLSNYKIDSLPEEIGLLKDLEVLILGSEYDRSQYVNTFTKLPDTIGDMHNLKVLAANNVPLTQLPASLNKLSQLQYLDISGNKYFSVFPEIIYSLTNLRVLRISYSTTLKKKIKPYTISDKLSQLQWLQRLFIGGDGFTALPNAIGILPYLECVFISRTSIESLPETISESRMLKELILFENRIKFLPDSIGNMTSLTSLKLTSEPMDYIPQSMIKLTNLAEFKLEDTPLNQKVPPSILNQSSRDIIRFLLDMQNDDVEKDTPNESKMIIVGQGGVGKTSLLNRLKYDEYTEKPSTVGIDVQEWPIETGEGDASVKKILRIWDFGGQEIYHATHQFFLSERSLYVLVWDALQDKEFGRIDYWLRTINLYAQDSPIFMVVNKCDGQTPDPRIDIGNYKKQYPNLVLPLYKVSCRDNKNIDELRTHLQNKANDLPLMHQEWPRGWIAVRKHLLELDGIGKHYIGYDMYLEICSSNNVNEESAESLIRCLHDLGFVLCFRNDSVLMKYVILEKEWGTKAVYQVLNYEKHNHGVISYDDLSKIWADSNVYPVETYNILLRLMHRFQLTFEIPQRKQLLVAELLDFCSIAPPKSFSGKDTLHWRCRYDFLPAGVMSRFIVASHNYLLEEHGNKLCWFRGAYLQNPENCRANIELFDGFNEGYIDVRVWHNEKADAFLNELRELLISINKTIPNLTYKELLRCNCNSGCTHFYSYDLLCHYKDHSQEHIRCEKSLSDVNIDKLLGDYGLMEDARQKEYQMMKKMNN